MIFSVNSIAGHNRLASGVILLCLLMFFAACGSNPLVEVRNTEKELPPSSLYLQNPIAKVPEIATNGQLLDLGLAWRKQLLECNADKASIEVWAKQVSPAPEPKAKEKQWFEFWK